MPSKPVLSERDKIRIKVNLQLLCEQLWVSQGYKKTSIKELCSRTEIAIGTFYSIFSTKEDLFFETAKAIQRRLTDQFTQTVLQGANKESLAKALKELFREFESKPFLYDVNTPDFLAFITKLSQQDMEAIKFESIEFFREVCRITKLTPKIDENKAFAALSALLSTITARQKISTMYDVHEVFGFMVDNIVSEMFD